MVEPWLTMVDHGLANHGWKHGSHHGWSLVNHCQPWFNHGWPWLTMLPWLMFRLGYNFLFSPLLISIMGKTQTRGVFHKGLRLVVRSVYSSQNPRTVRKSRTVRGSVSQRLPVAANCKYVQLTLSKPVRTRLEFSETDLRTVSGYDQFAADSSQVAFLLRVRTNILVKHPPGQLDILFVRRLHWQYMVPGWFKLGSPETMIVD